MERRKAHCVANYFRLTLLFALSWFHARLTSHNFGCTTALIAPLTHAAPMLSPCCSSITARLLMLVALGQACTVDYYVTNEKTNNRNKAERACAALGLTLAEVYSEECHLALAKKVLSRPISRSRRLGDDDDDDDSDDADNDDDDNDNDAAASTNLWLGAKWSGAWYWDSGLTMTGYAHISHDTTNSNGGACLQMVRACDLGLTKPNTHSLSLLRFCPRHSYGGPRRARAM